jgi:hypothetical protein
MINPSPKYSGEPSAQALAGGLATLGRYGDNYMVHAAEGETMIPKEVFDENPGLKQDLFRQMTMMGIEDPNRYVIGNELNSINPITGQPEFFFKKVFRAIKRVVKKIAPIVAPILGNLIAPGIGGIVASGLVTKLQGGSWGDALKSAALSYGASALTSGIGGALQGTSIGNFIGSGTPAVGSTFGGRFMTGLGTGLSAPFSAASNLFSSGAQNPLAQGILGPRTLGTSGIFSSLAGTKANPSAFAQSGQKGIMGTLFPKYETGINYTSTGAQAPQLLNSGAPEPQFINQQRVITNPNSGLQETMNVKVPNPNFGTMTVQDPATGTLKRMPIQSSGVSATNQATRSGAGAGQYLQAQAGGGASGASGASVGKAPDFFTRNFGEMGGEFAKKALAGAIVPVGLAAAAYALTPEQETEAELIASLDATNPRRVAYDKWQQVANKNSPEAQSLLNTWYGQSQYSTADLASKFGANPISGITSLAAAGGGEIVGPGTGTSDSIPARLSDGEFVMTAQAVRNAGNGNRDVGAARMYDMMNRFERGAV